MTTAIKYGKRNELYFEEAELLKRANNLKIVNLRKGGISDADAMLKAETGLMKELHQAIAEHEALKQRYIQNGLLFYWDGRIKHLTETDIMPNYSLIIVDDTGDIWFNKSEVCRLAKSIQRHSGLNLSLAMEHAWFWARRQKKDVIGHFNRAKFEAKRQSRTAYALQAMINNESPEEYGSYNRYMMDFKLWKREFNKLILADENTAPKVVMQHWNCNIGNIFNHYKYGDCIITSHKVLKGEWFIMYRQVNDEHLYKLEMSKFRALSRGGQLPIVKPVLEACNSMFGEVPVYQGPDI